MRKLLVLFSLFHVAAGFAQPNEQYRNPEVLAQALKGLTLGSCKFDAWFNRSDDNTPLSVTLRADSPEFFYFNEPMYIKTFERVFLYSGYSTKIKLSTKQPPFPVGGTKYEVDLWLDANGNIKWAKGIDRDITYLASFGRPTRRVVCAQ